MARTRRVKREGDAHYHIMSRTNGKLHLLSDSALKREIMREIERIAAFSGVGVDAFCLMDNHFHIVCNVVKPDQPLSEVDVLKRIAILKGDDFTENLSNHWAELRKIGCAAAVDDQLNAWRSRMHDVSAFAKTLKERINIIYKRRHEHCGSIWSGRFTSTWIEDGRYLATCIRYVELNPVRAGLVRRARDYAFSSRNSESAAFYGRFAGYVPEERVLLKRVAQITSGVVFGSRAHVERVLGACADCFHGGNVRARAVFGDAYSSHGHRLAEKMVAA